VNNTLARVEQVRGFRVLPRDFTIEDGELTPTLKIKRRVILSNFAEEIESMYQE
jgi:long-chain acyl-CoA synthetase